MKIKNFAALLLALAMMFSLCACGSQSAPAQDTPQPSEAQESAAPSEAPSEITVTDMIGRELTVTPGSYTRVVCIGAGALRMYSYIGDVSLLCGVEDIDNLTLEERPKMFDSVARPYVLAYGDVFSTLPSCGVGGPNAQAAEAEKILSCNPDIVISEYEDVEKEDALQEQLGVPVVTLKSGPNGVFDDAFSQSMTLLGQIFGEEEKAEALVSFIAAETAEIAERTASIADEDKPAVYVCGLGNWGTTNHLMTSQTYASFEVANIRNVVTDLGANGVQPIEEEKFVALGADMDIIVMDAAAVKNIKPLYQEDPTMFDSCKAWQTGEVYLEMAYNAYYTNYEIALINTWFIAKSVYPDLFADVDITARTNEITPAFRLLESTSQNPTAELRAAILSLDGDEPAAVVRRYDDTDLTTLAVKAAADLGPLFLDGLADGIRILDDRFTEAQLRDVELMILQAARVRFSHTEYIACPSCGRTLYDIEGTLAQIKARTSHLKNLKIGVMGCIVNGPGEMADADYGYVGAAPGRITLYKGRTVVERNIPQEEALDRLIALIRENGDWQEPE